MKGINQMAKIFIVIGKSSTGKDTIYKRLLQAKDLDLKKVVMYTTRPRRSLEIHGEEYYFVDMDKLRYLESKNMIIEKRTYNTIHGPWNYFTVNDGQIDLDKLNYLMIGTLEAYVGIKKYFGEKNVIPLYIEVDDGVRIHRALLREKNQEEPRYKEMCRRYLADEDDFSEDKLFESGIKKRYENIDIDECIGQISKDIKNTTIKG